MKRQEANGQVGGEEARTGDKLRRRNALKLTTECSIGDGMNKSVTVGYFLGYQRRFT